MQATEILMSEHRVIERVIGALESAAGKIQAGEEVRPEFFVEAANFIRGFADGCHHKKEEGVLFQAMAQSGVPVQGGPVGVMLVEHDQGRAYTRAMLMGAEAWKDGNLSGREQAMGAALGYAALLRQHIYKEDHILFPMADRVIPVEQHGEITSGFEQVEHEETGEGVHEKYLALADRLVAEAQR